jgi:hypothetical protein
MPKALKGGKFCKFRFEYDASGVTVWVSREQHCSSPPLVSNNQINWKVSSSVQKARFSEFKDKIEEQIVAVLRTSPS